MFSKVELLYSVIEFCWDIWEIHPLFMFKYQPIFSPRVWICDSMNLVAHAYRGECGTLTSSTECTLSPCLCVYEANYKVAVKQSSEHRSVTPAETPTEIWNELFVVLFHHIGALFWPGGKIVWDISGIFGTVWGNSKALVCMNQAVTSAIPWLIFIFFNRLANSLKKRKGPEKMLFSE